MLDIPWIPVASTAGLIGVVWQTVLAVAASVDSMSSFIGAHNAILRDEQAAIYREVPSWRIMRRRQRVKQARVEAMVVLTPTEQRLSRRYDLEASGWSFGIVATLVVTVVAWVDWIG